jgi:hypothetical protein
MSISAKRSYQNKSKFSLLTLLATIAITLPIGVYFISQQNTNLTDQRNKAGWNNSYLGCSLTSCGAGYSCHCQDGPACTQTGCVPNSDLKSSCLNQGRSWCISGKNRNAYTCCDKGYTCYPNGRGGCKK